MNRGAEGGVRAADVRGGERGRVGNERDTGEHARRPVDQRPVARRARGRGAVARHGAGGFIKTPIRQQPRLRAGKAPAHVRLNLRLAPRRVPDAHLVQHAVESADGIVAKQDVRRPQREVVARAVPAARHGPVDEIADLLARRHDHCQMHPLIRGHGARLAVECAPPAQFQILRVVVVRRDTAHHHLDRIAAAQKALANAPMVSAGAQKRPRADRVVA